MKARITTLLALFALTAACATEKPVAKDSTPKAPDVEETQQVDETELSAEQKDLLAEAKDYDFATLANESNAPKADELEHKDDLGAACGGFWFAVVNNWYNTVLKRGADNWTHWYAAQICQRRMHPNHVYFLIRCSVEGRLKNGNC